MEGHKCRIYCRNLAEMLLQRIMDDVAWIHDNPNASKENVSKRWDDIDEARKIILDMVPEHS